MTLQIKLTSFKTIKDTLKLWMINFNRDETYNILGQLKQEFANSTAPSGVGLASNFRISIRRQSIRKVLTFKTLLNVLELDVNYNVIRNRYTRRGPPL